MMPNNATRAGKRKRVVMEGGLDSDSGEERDVDIGVIVDGHGHSRVGRTDVTHLKCRSQASSKLACTTIKFIALHLT